jgi:O-antigen ligase
MTFVSKCQQKLRIPMQWCVISIGLFAPISVVLDNLMLALILLGALFSLTNISRIVISNPVARAALLLFSALMVAMFYGPTPIKEALSTLLKYIDLLFVPIFIVILSKESFQRKARYAFHLGMSITLVLSYLVGLRILPVMHWMDVFCAQNNPVIFHSHVTQNSMMAFAVFLALLEWRDAIISWKKLAWMSFALLGTINVLFMVIGRTGYLILIMLLGWFAWSTSSRLLHDRGKNWTWSKKSLVVLLLLAGIFGAYSTSSRLQDRVALAVSEYQEWSPNHGKDTSSGQRLDFYYNTLQIVHDHPLFGVGTGGFPSAYAQQTVGKDVMETRNPHNEYLLISVQTGIIGFVLMLYLFYTQWRYATALPNSFEQDAARGLVLACMVNCMVNSPLLNHADGLLFSFMTAILFSNLKVGVKT